MRKFLLSLMTLTTLIILFSLNIQQKNYINPLKNFNNSIFKVLLLEKYLNVPMATGTGFVVDYKDNKSLIITNEHVCNSYSEEDEFLSSYNILIQNHNEIFSMNGKRVYVAKTDKTKDLCALVYFGKLDPIKIQENFNFDVTKELYIIGASAGNFPVITKAIPSVKNFSNIPKEALFPDMLNTDMFMVSGLILSGTSGSPIINDNGEAVGIVFASDESTSALVVTGKEIKLFIKNIIF